MSDSPVPMDQAIAAALDAAEDFSCWARKHLEQPSPDTNEMVLARATGAMVALMALGLMGPDDD